MVATRRSLAKAEPKPKASKAVQPAAEPAAEASAEPVAGASEPRKVDKKDRSRRARAATRGAREKEKGIKSEVPKKTPEEKWAQKSKRAKRRSRVAQRKRAEMGGGAEADAEVKDEGSNDDET